MTGILSKDEMDSLLDTASGKIPSTADIVKDGIPINFYDFITEYHKSVTRSPGFNAINASFSNALRNNLFRLLRIKGQVTCLEPDIMSYAQYGDYHAEQAIIGMLLMKPHHHHILISLDQNLIFTAIEVLFGGSTNASKPHRREFGQIDLKVGELLIEQVSSCLQDAWENVSKLAFDLVKTTVDHTLPNRIARTEKMVIQKYGIKLNDISSEIHVCIPYEIYQSISPLLEHDESTEQSDIEAGAWAQGLTSNVYHSNIYISAQITETQLPLKAISQLQVGDIIAIDDPAVGTLLAEGIKLFKVKCGVQEGKKVVEVLKRVND